MPKHYSYKIHRWGRCGKLALSMCVVGLLAAVPTLAQTVTTPATVKLETGVQQAFGELSDTRVIGGHDVRFDGFSGVIGASVDTAYILVTEGRVSVDNLMARPGDVLILPAMMAPPTKEMFDAERYAAALPESVSAAVPEISGQLAKISKRQGRSIFFGRHERTRFNLAAPVSADVELARRSLMGNEIVASIRYSGVSGEAVEEAVVAAFEEALKAGDVDAVAALLDPVPFGSTDLRNGAIGARKLLAAELIASRDWAGALSGRAFTDNGDGGWMLTSADTPTTLYLKSYGDFMFVSSVQQGT